MNTRNNISLFFFGSSPYVFPIISLLNTNFTLKGVLTTEMNTKSGVLEYCKELAVPCQTIQSFENPSLLQELKKTDAGLSVVADFGLILPPSILTLFPKGILNIHPSLLPKYRGPSPVQSAILAGDTLTGVSIIKLDEQMDHGPLLAQQEEKVSPTDTAQTLYERLFTKGADILTEVIPSYIKGTSTPKEQDHTHATYTKKLTRQEGFVDIHTIGKELLDRTARAYHPWPGAWTWMTINNKKVRVKLLPAGMIQVEGKKPMTYKDFMNGYPASKGILMRFL